MAALQTDTYLRGTYAAIRPGGVRGDDQTSIGYDPTTGEIVIDPPAGREFTSINIDSAAGIFTEDPAQNLGGAFDNDSDNNIFKATFFSSFGALSFGNVALRWLSEPFIFNDLTVIGSLAGGGPGRVAMRSSRLPRMHEITGPKWGRRIKQNLASS